MEPIKDILMETKGYIKLKIKEAMLKLSEKNGKNITIRDIAKKIGKNQTEVSRLASFTKQKQNNPQLKTITLLAEALDCTDDMNKLLEYVPSENIQI